MSTESLEPGLGEELVDDYRVKFEEVESRYYHKEQELAEAKKKIVDLNRRYQDAVRAYEQERRVSWGCGINCGATVFDKRTFYM